VQGQGDERGVFQVHAVAKAAGLHPDADRDTRGLHKLERFEEFIEGFEQLVFGQTRRGEQAVAVFEKVHEENRGAKKTVSEGESSRMARFPQPAASALKATFVSTTTRIRYASGGAKRRSFFSHQSAFPLVPKVGLWERTLPGAIPLRGGRRDQRSVPKPTPHRKAQLPRNASVPKAGLNEHLPRRIAAAKAVLEKEGETAYRVHAQSICTETRKLVERMIEWDLLADVIQRHRRAIKTMGKLDKLADTQPEDCKFLDEMMTKYSRYEHAQSAELRWNCRFLTSFLRT